MISPVSKGPQWSGLPPLSRPVADSPQSGGGGGSLAAEETLAPEQKQQIAELASIEREVIAHERAHQSAGGAYTGSATYGYTEGPDGKAYITSGEVAIRAPQIEPSEKGLQVVEQVKRAALAPANPSGQDLRVASKMEAIAQRIRAEMAKRSYAEKDTPTPEIDMVL